jgi:PHP family Zn ribbon phosphoesterase
MNTHTPTCNKIIKKQMRNRIKEHTQQKKTPSQRKHQISSMTLKLQHCCTRL